MELRARIRPLPRRAALMAALVALVASAVAGAVAPSAHAAKKKKAPVVTQGLPDGRRRRRGADHPRPNFIRRPQEEHRGVQARRRARGVRQGRRRHDEDAVGDGPGGAAQARSRSRRRPGSDPLPPARPRQTLGKRFTSLKHSPIVWARARRAGRGRTGRLRRRQDQERRRRRRRQRPAARTPSRRGSAPTRASADTRRRRRRGRLRVPLRARPQRRRVPAARTCSSPTRARCRIRTRGFADAGRRLRRRLADADARSTTSGSTRTAVDEDRPRSLDALSYSDGEQYTRSRRIASGTHDGRREPSWPRPATRRPSSSSAWAASAGYRTVRLEDPSPASPGGITTPCARSSGCST